MLLRITLLAFAMLLTPLAAHADYLDVFVNKLKAGCSLDKYLAVVEEFRGVMKSQGYKYTVEIATPFIGPDLSAIYWVGRGPNSASFGQETDRWDAAIAKPGTPEAKINDKLNACAESVSRTVSLTR